MIRKSSPNALQSIIQMRPDAASPHWHLGCVLVELDRLQEAISHFRKASNIRPEIRQYRVLSISESDAI